MRRECRERFPGHRLQRKPAANDPGIHHGMCVTHVPWCMSGSLIRSGEKNVPGIPGACAIHNFTYLARGPWCYMGDCTRGSGFVVFWLWFDSGQYQKILHGFFTAQGQFYGCPSANGATPMTGISSHYNDVITRAMSSQITSLTIVYSAVYLGVDQRKHQSPASLAFVRGIHRWRWIPRTKGHWPWRCEFDSKVCCEDLIKIDDIFRYKMPDVFSLLIDNQTYQYIQGVQFDGLGTNQSILNRSYGIFSIHLLCHYNIM